MSDSADIRGIWYVRDELGELRQVAPAVWEWELDEEPPVSGVRLSGPA